MRPNASIASLSGALAFTSYVTVTLSEKGELGKSSAAVTSSGQHDRRSNRKAVAMAVCKQKTTRICMCNINKRNIKENTKTELF